MANLKPISDEELKAEMERREKVNQAGPRPQLVIPNIKIETAKESPTFVLFSLKGLTKPEFQWVCDAMDLNKQSGNQMLSRSQAMTPEEALSKARQWCREQGIYGE